VCQVREPSEQFSLKFTDPETFAVFLEEGGTFVVLRGAGTPEVFWIHVRTENRRQRVD